MARLSTTIARFVKDEAGATAIEYALIASGIAAAIVAGLTTLGVSVTAKWTSVSTALR